MKTFDEVIRGCVTSENEEEDRRNHDHIDKFRSMEDEIRNHPAVVRLVCGLAALVDQQSIGGVTAILSAFINGVRIGIEMEKAE